MIGYLLMFSIVLGFTSLTVYGLAWMRKAQRLRRREARLATAFHRARYARMHGFNPVTARRPPIGPHALWRAGSR